MDRHLQRQVQRLSLELPAAQETLRMLRSHAAAARIQAANGVGAASKLPLNHTGAGQRGTLGFSVAATGAGGGAELPAETSALEPKNQVVSLEAPDALPGGVRAITTAVEM